MSGIGCGFIPHDQFESDRAKELMVTLEATGMGFGQALGAVANRFGMDHAQCLWDAHMEGVDTATLPSWTGILAVLDEVGAEAPAAASEWLGQVLLRGDVASRNSQGRAVSMTLRITNRPWLTTLPNGLVVADKLDLGGNASLRELPADMVVMGGLDLMECSALESVPKDLDVRDWIDLSGCVSLRALPEGFVARSWLWLRDCVSLKSLPKGLRVGSDLDICGSGIADLPEGLDIGGDLVVGIGDLVAMAESMNGDGRIRIGGQIRLES
jgi:hypothetical protein